MRLCRTVLGGYRDQPAAVIEGNCLYSRRQRPVAVDLFDFSLDPGQYVLCMLCPIHYHNGRHHIVVSIAAALAQPWHIAHVDLRNVFHQDRNAVRLREDDIFDVIDLPALGQIGSAPAVDQADAADIDRLLADIDRSPAHVDIGVADGADQLGYGNAIGLKLVEIGLDFEFLGRTAPGVDLHNPGTDSNLRCRIQSWTVRRFVSPKLGGPTTWYRKISPTRLDPWMVGLTPLGRLTLCCRLSAACVYAK